MATVMSNNIVLSADNAHTYDRLFVTLEAGLGSLQILLAVCDNSALRQKVIEQYEQELQVHSYRLQQFQIQKVANNTEKAVKMKILIK